MSHFTVMVIGFNAEEQLARFDENLAVPEYCLCEVSEEKKSKMLDYYNKEQCGNYKSFEACYEAHGDDWNSNSYRKDEDGIWREYTTYNPDAKWDWYQLGGRWSGSFRLKPGKEGVTGESGVFDNETGIDQAFKKDIDFESIYQEAREEALKHYREVVEACGGSIPKLEIAAPDRRTDLPDDADYKALWAEYHAQESVKLFQEKLSNRPFGPELDDYQCTEEEYVQNAENAAISTFAYVLNGAWYQRGQMGWFACVRDTSMSQVEWNKHMREMVDALPGDTLISIYDCHI